MLLICPVRPGDTNEELRYALRSWETNLILPTALHLMIVGHCPSWLKPDWFVQGNRHTSMPFAVFDNIRLGAEEATQFKIEEAVYMNDDFFCLDPVGAILPVRRDITLAEHIAKFPPSSSLWWPRSLALTASWLAEAGFPHPWSFEAHRPLICKPEAMFESLSRWDIDSGDTVPQWRTAYGALNEVEAYPIVDAKLGPRTPGIGTPWVSTSDQTWRRYAPQVKKRFQKPSRWEKS